MPTNNNETTVFVDIGILVYLDFVFPPPFPQMGGGGYLNNQSNRVHIMQLLLSNLDFDKKRKERTHKT